MQAPRLSGTVFYRCIMNKNLIFLSAAAVLGAISFFVSDRTLSDGFFYLAAAYICGSALCYLLILRLSKSYVSALFTVLSFCIASAFFSFYETDGRQIHFAIAILAGLVSFYLYTFIYAKGLKHNQDKHFLAVSAVLFFAGLFFSPAIAVLPVLLFIYEAGLIKQPDKKKIFFKISPFIAAALIAFAANTAAKF
jgi:hypothetical protein